jgi:hypothetical protein
MLLLVAMSAAGSPGPERVQRCLLCRGVVDRHSDGRFVTTSCRECHAVLRIEFNPPDDPTLSARIERLDDVGDGDSVECGSVHAAASPDAA